MILPFPSSLPSPCSFALAGSPVSFLSLYHRRIRWSIHPYVPLRTHRTK